MDIPRIIERGTRNWGSKVAIVSGDRRFTFQEVDERSNRLANGLLSLGCRPRSHLGVMLNNCHQYIEIYFAKHKLNIAWVTLSLRLNDEELIWQINDSEIDTLLVGEESLERVTSIRASLRNVKRYITVAGTASGFTDYEELISGSSAQRPQIEAQKD